MGLEARLLEAAAKGGVPVPALVAASDDPAVLGSPFLVTDHVDGETIPRKILRGEEFRAVRPRLAGQCGEILARLHAIDPGTVESLDGTDQVTQYREAFDSLGQPHPPSNWPSAGSRPPAATRALMRSSMATFVTAT